jgi:hypothetical protein
LAPWVHRGLVQVPLAPDFTLVRWIYRQTDTRGSWLPVFPPPCRKILPFRSGASSQLAAGCWLLVSVDMSYVMNPPWIMNAIDDRRSTPATYSASWGLPDARELNPVPVARNPKNVAPHCFETCHVGCRGGGARDQGSGIRDQGTTARFLTRLAARRNPPPTTSQLKFLGGHI